MEHLTIGELLKALEICHTPVPANCVGCPNSVTESLDENGLSKCRFDLTEETVWTIRKLSEKRSTASLVEELAKREGITKKIAEPYQDEQIMVNGPATVLIITD